jgi:hypothetical protein
MPRKSPQSVAELFAAHEAAAEEGKKFWELKDKLLKKLVRAWKKDRKAVVEPGKVLEIEDRFRGQMKAFAPGFAHRYNLKLRNISDLD